MSLSQFLSWGHQLKTFSPRLPISIASSIPALNILDEGVSLNFSTMPFIIAMSVALTIRPFILA